MNNEANLNSFKGSLKDSLNKHLEVDSQDVVDNKSWLPNIWKPSLSKATIKFEDFVFENENFVLPKPLREYLWKKGVEDPFSLLDFSLSSVTKASSMYRALEACALLHDYRDRPILIYGDYDMDGSCGSSLLYIGLKELGYTNLKVFQPNRFSDGYGVHVSCLKKLHEDFPFELILTVDVGVNANEAGDWARDNNIKFIITDHHLPKAELPHCDVLIDPHQENGLDELKELCGTGVAFYLLLALKGYQKERGICSDNFNPKNHLDLFTLATITDMVPLRKNNRVFIKHGFNVLKQTNKPGLEYLLKNVDLMDIMAEDVGFRIAPKLNSLTRLDENIKPRDLFLCEDTSYAAHLVQETLRLNKKRTDLQKKAVEEAEEYFAQNPPDGFCLYVSENFHLGVIGLVANRISQTYQVPTFIGGYNPQGEAVGSARCAEGVHLQRVMEACPSLNGFGGHALAAGFHVDPSNLEAFYNELKSYFKNSKSIEQSISYDSVMKLEDFDDLFFSWFKKLDPFGMSFESPRFAFIKEEVLEVRELKGGHLKLKFKVPNLKNKKTMDAIWFNPEGSVIYQGDDKNRSSSESLKDDPLFAGDKVSFIAEIQKNEFRGQTSWQFNIVSLLRSDI